MLKLDHFLLGLKSKLSAIDLCYLKTLKYLYRIYFIFKFKKKTNFKLKKF